MTTRIDSFNPRHMKVNGEDNQGIIMIKVIMIRVIFKISIDQIAEIEGHHSEVKVSMDRIIGEEHVMSIMIEMILGETILEKCKITEDKISEVDIEGIIELEVGLGKEYFSRNDRSNSRSRSGSRASTNRDRIRCFKCREYDHLAKDCLNSQTEKQPEQIQQMYNLDEEQTA